jgi:NADPH:quinone reductase-like Zn-dependent oxidoreductase
LIARDVPVPSPGAGQVLIRVTARSINPADFLFIQGRYRVKPTFPQVAGFDGVGVVTACGPGVGTPRIGTRVAFRSPGAWGELAVAPAARTYAVPPDISDELACQFALNPFTAWGLLAESHADAGARVLATAGHSIVARLLAALSRRRSIRLTLLVRVGGGFAALDGATGSPVARAGTVQEVLTNLTATGGFRAILDAVGGAATSWLLNALDPLGRFVTYGTLDDSAITLHASTMVSRNLTWSGFGVEAWLAGESPAVRAAAEEELWTLLRDERGLLPVIDRFPLDQFGDAIQAVRQARQPGKVLLV